MNLSRISEPVVSLPFVDFTIISSALTGRAVRWLSSGNILLYRQKRCHILYVTSLGDACMAGPTNQTECNHIRWSEPKNSEKRGTEHCHIPGI